LASSGIENVVKLWTPTAEFPTELQEAERLMKKNKERVDLFMIFLKIYFSTKIDLVLKLSHFLH
jgi:hypothetical protein